MGYFIKLVVVGWKTFLNGAKHKEEGTRVKRLILTGVALVFVASIFAIFVQMLTYFNFIPMFGAILVWKLLGMVFLSFMFLLLFSNIIVTISTFYLSDDMYLLFTTPAPVTSILASRFIHTAINSSWMVFAMGIPIFAAYSVVMKGGIGAFIFSMAVLTLLLVTIASMSISLAMSLMRSFSARRTRDFFILLSIAVLSFIVVLLRLIKPERFTNPHELAGFTEFMASFEAPDAPYLPSGWATNAITGFFKHDYSAAFMNLGWLLISSVVCFSLMLYLGHKVYMKGWWNNAENQLAKYRLKKIDRYDLRKLFPFVKTNIVEVAVKDIKNFTRDSSQWPQLMMLVSIVIIYLFNVTNLNLGNMPTSIYAKYINDVIFFLNMGFAGFIISAVAARFVFSSISLEGKSFWVIKTSPMGMKAYIWEKFWMSFVPLLFISEILICLSIYFLKIEFFMALVSMAVVFCFSICIASMGIGIGAKYPKFRVDNTADIAASYGGIIYMIFSMLYIGISVVLVAIPVNAYYAIKVTGAKHFSKEYVIGAVIVFFAVQLIAFVAPMIIGEKALDNMEV